MKETDAQLQRLEQYSYQENINHPPQEFEMALNGAKAKIENLTGDPIPMLAILGPQGTNTDQAAAEFFGDNYNSEEKTMGIAEKENNSAMIQSVINGEADMAFIPVESSEGGNVSTLYELAESDLEIVGEGVMGIEHIIVSSGNLDEIKKIRSHQQALIATSKWREENLPNAELEEVGSTAGAVKDLSENPDPSVAAIGSRRASEIYDGVEKLEEKSIANNPDAATRFWLITKRGETEPTGEDKTTLTFKISDEPGALIKALESFSSNEINLKKLVSLGGNEDEVKFLATIEGHQNDFKTESAVKGLNGNIKDLKLKGSYAADKYSTPDKDSAPDISDDMVEKARNDKTARDSDSSLKILFTTADYKGSLLEAIRPISDAGINITHINSIETGRGLDEYGFRIDIDTKNVDESTLTKALNKLYSSCNDYSLI